MFPQSVEVLGLQPLGPQVQRLRLTNYERVARPSQYLEEIQARLCPDHPLSWSSLLSEIFPLLGFKRPFQGSAYPSAESLASMR